MIMGQIFMALVSTCFGLLVSSGIFTVFVTVALVPRLAGKTHTNKKFMLYEDCICAGTILGCIFSVFNRNIEFGKWILENGILPERLWLWVGNFLLVVFGLFAGIFVGCLALAIAEMLNAIPIFIRRLDLKKGLVIVVAAMALGKLAGSLIYFSQSMFLYGG